MLITFLLSYQSDESSESREDKSGGNDERENESRGDNIPQSK